REAWGGNGACAGRCRLCAAGDREPLVAYAFQLRAAGVAVAQSDVWTEPADAGRDQARSGRRPRAHTMNAITTAVASPNQGMAYCMWSSLRCTESGPGLGTSLCGTGASRSM